LITRHSVEEKLLVATTTDLEQKRYLIKPQRTKREEATQPQQDTEKRYEPKPEFETLEKLQGAHAPRTDFAKLKTST
jgi:hypothetical protein